MTTAGHYREAERLANQALDDDYLDEPVRARYAAVAQVHATLALVEVGCAIEERLGELDNSLDHLAKSTDAPVSDVIEAIKEAGFRAGDRP